MDFGGDDDGVRRGYKPVFGDGEADLAEGDFGGESLAVEDHRLGVTIVDVHYGEGEKHE